MGTLQTDERPAIVRHLIKMLDSGKKDEDLMAYLLRTYPLAMSTNYGLVREAKLRSDALESRKGPKDEMSGGHAKKGGGD